VLRNTPRKPRLVAAAAITCAAVFAPTLTASSAVVKPVIGRATAKPAQAVAGRPFAIAAKITRSDTGRSLTHGVVQCRPTVGSKAVAHTDSFKGGVARCSFTIPATATSLRVTLTVSSGTGSASRTFRFAVHPAPKPSLSIDDVTVAEGNAGTTTMSLRVTLSKRSTQAVSVGYATSDGTATAPSDYVSANGTLSFAPGETSKTVAVSVVADTAIEPDETVAVTLSSPVNATIANGSATATIRNDDTQVPVVAGEYRGQLPAGDYLYFEVTGDRQLSYFRLNDIRENCSPGGYFEGSLAFRRETKWPIADDGTAGASDEWRGSEVQGDFTLTYSAYKVTARFNGASVAGTIRLQDQFTYKGTAFSCDTGDVAWTATKTV
jgi:hypothetical protein